MTGLEKQERWLPLRPADRRSAAVAPPDLPAVVSATSFDSCAAHRRAAGLLERRRFCEARPIYVEICEHDPRDAEAWLMLGAIDAEFGMLDDAAGYLANAVACEPAMTEARIALADVHWRRGRIDVALDAMMRACEREPACTKAWRRLGRARLDAGDPEGALTAFERIVVHHRDLETTLGLVEALLKTGRVAEALDRCATLEGDAKWYWSGLARQGLGQRSGALHDWSRISSKSRWYVPARWQAHRQCVRSVPRFIAHHYAGGYFDRHAAVYDHRAARGESTGVHAGLRGMIHERLPAHGANILDLGCGTGYLGRSLRRSGDLLTGVDLSAGMLDFADRLGGYDLLVRAPLEDRLAADAGDVDLILLGDVLEWCPDPEWILGALLAGDRSVPLVVITAGVAASFAADALSPVERIALVVEDALADRDVHRMTLRDGGRVWLVAGRESTPAKRVSLGRTGTVRALGVRELAAGASANGRGDCENAGRHLESALAKNPRSVDTLFQLGLMEQSRKRYDAARNRYRQALDIEPGFAPARFQIGVIDQIRGEYEQAVNAYREAIAAGAREPALFGNLAFALERLDPPDRKAARDALRSLLSLDPVNRQALAAWARLASDDGDRCGTQSSNAQPRLATLEEVAAGDAGVLLAFAAALRERGFHRRVVDLIRKVLAERPDDHNAALQLALALKEAGDLSAAISVLEELVDRHTHPESVRDNLAGLYAACEEIEKAGREWERGCRRAPPWSGIHHNRLFMYNYSPRARRLAEMHFEWGRAMQQAAGPPPAHYTNHRDPDKRLRIGYVSADLYGHSVSHFIEPVLANHDHDRFEIYCYSNSDRHDAVTMRLRYHTDHWRRIKGCDDGVVAAQVRADGIDILVDLSGHTGGSRLPLFARKPAPVQATWLGYPNTTGLDRIDYRITDELADPPGLTESLHSERLFRLDQCFLCYRPPADAPAVRVDVGRRPEFTFGCFNNLYKITPAVIAAWSRILHAVPDATLLMKSFGFTGDRVYERYAGLFASEGIDDRRIHMMGRLGGREHLSLYSRIGVMLDPFPYNGTTSTCEALWMGVPVIALAGDRHAARVGASLLSALGCSELIAADEDAYVKLAIDLARDPRRLTDYKLRLRRCFMESCLADHAGHTARLETAYREMWRRWCGSESG